MWIAGTTAEVAHCQHCSPAFYWIENEAGKAPQFAFRGFPRDGQVVISKNTVIVVCSRCQGQLDVEKLLA